MARAIVNRPQILLADEPTGSLDKKSAYEIMEFLKLINAQGTTVFMVTHMHELIDVIDKKTIIGLENGRINMQPIIYNALRQLY